MNKHKFLSGILSVTGLVMMTIGAVTILWSGGINHFLGSLLGSGIVRFWSFPLGGGMVALGAFLGKSRYRKFLYGALALTVCGLIAFILMAIASFEAPTFGWYMFVVSACPITGAIMSLVGAVLIVVESLRGPVVPKHGAEAM
ncbi:MAG: hypothetical protein ACYDH4_01965 [Candidatus Cryosericum sp.]